jgi:HPt (histidine-containing phosphotransfer) domain-containing protein
MKTMDQDPTFSLEEALARLDDDRETFQMIVELFVEQGPKDLAEARAALDSRNAVGLARSSHRLKGAILQFCAPAVLQACKDLEAAAKGGNLQDAGGLYAILERELLRLLSALRQVRSKGIAA